jgi:hypothetical protein
MSLLDEPYWHQLTGPVTAASQLVQQVCNEVLGITWVDT